MTDYAGKAKRPDAAKEAKSGDSQSKKSSAGGDTKSDAKSSGSKE